MRSNAARTLTALILLIVTLGAWAGLAHAKTPKLGLDLQGGTSVVLQAKPGQNVTDDAMNQAVEIIRLRVDSLGISEAQVVKAGTGADATITVSVPGATGTQVADLVGRTAELRFRQVIDEAGAPVTTPSATPTPTPSGSTTAKPTPSPSAKATQTPSSSPTPTASSKSTNKSTALATPTPTPTTTITPDSNPAGSTPVAGTQQEATSAFLTMTCGSQSTQGIRDKASDYLATCDQSNPVKYLLDPATVVGTDVASATATQTTQGLGGWEVDLTFTSEGTKKFGDLTAQAVTATPPANQVAIVLDGLVVSSPVIQTAIPGGTASITGNFTQQQATDLANVLKYGALPLSLEIGQITSVSPSLGSDALSAGLLAGLIGLIAVGIFVLIYYRFLGLVAIASLTVAGALTYLAMCLLGNYASFTLTLAGVTGAIVAIGITADSFVVYFERIRDELREGRNLRAAVSFGWVRARRTIITADAVSLLAATVLYLMSTGSVRGFAFTLGLTTVVDLLVVFAFTRPLMTILANGRLIDPSAKWSGLSKVRRPQEMVKRHA